MGPSASRSKHTKSAVIYWGANNTPTAPSSNEQSSRTERASVTARVLMCLIPWPPNRYVVTSLPSSIGAVDEGRMRGRRTCAPSLSWCTPRLSRWGLQGAPASDHTAGWLRLVAAISQFLYHFRHTYKDQARRGLGVLGLSRHGFAGRIWLL